MQNATQNASEIFLRAFASPWTASAQAIRQQPAFEPSAVCKAWPTLRKAFEKETNLEDLKELLTHNMRNIYTW